MMYYCVEWIRFRDEIVLFYQDKSRMIFDVSVGFAYLDWKKTVGWKKSMKGSCIFVKSDGSIKEIMF